MKTFKRISVAAIALCGAMLFAACGAGGGDYMKDVKETDKDFTSLDTPGKQEKSYDYKFNFLPEEDGAVFGPGTGDQGYVGDTMPYYEDGTYYIYYLKDRGDSYEHSVYLATTEDFVHWEDHQDPILESDRGSGQDTMIGTGSVVKVENKYYFFYTGHNGNQEYHEKIMVAEGDSPTSFTKKAGWEITPPSQFGKNDFRDPQAYYNEETEKITLTITAPQDGIARILSYTLDKDLSNATYGDLVYTNDETVVGDVFNLECSDTFKVGNKWYLTFSAQDGVIWYTSADTQYGPYTATPKPLDGHLFYAAKHVSDGTDTYMVGWIRSTEPTDSSTNGILKGWGGNMMVQKVQTDGDSIRLIPVPAYEDHTEERVLVSGSTVKLKAGSYTESFRCFERYMVTGEFKCDSAKTFGFAFADINGEESDYKKLILAPSENKISFAYDNGESEVTSIPADLDTERTYSFIYIQEGSVGVLYVGGQVSALTVRLYGVSGKNVMLFAEGGSATFSGLKQYTYTY